jgi:hypothetical protein
MVFVSGDVKQEFGILQQAILSVNCFFHLFYLFHLFAHTYL